jgi:fatty acid elongase 3
MIQIIQFVIDIGVGYFASPYSQRMFRLVLNSTAAYMHVAATYYDRILPHMGDCAISDPAAVFGCILLTSYLGLFINFYMQTYKRGDKARLSNSGH